MPYKSEAQRKYFNANRKQLESEGVDVDEWNESSKGKKLPEKVKEARCWEGYEPVPGKKPYSEDSCQPVGTKKKKKSDKEKAAATALLRMNGLAKFAETEYEAEQKAKKEETKEKKHQAREKLGPLESGYIADAMGGRAIENLGKKYQEMREDPENRYQSDYDRARLSSSGMTRAFGERINRGASRMAESPGWRVLSAVDPTRDGSREGIVGTLAGFGGGDDRAEGAKRRAGEAYAKFLAKHQDKLKATATPSERQTPYHLGLQASLANQDSDVAGHNYLRRERPLHYWLNPTARSGPVKELATRASRRLTAGMATPESTGGRAAMALGGLGTLGLLPILMGGEGAQQKLRAAAAQNELYAPEAMPKAAFDISQLARAAAGAGLGAGAGYLGHQARELIDPSKDEEQQRRRRNLTMLAGAGLGGGAGALTHAPKPNLRTNLPGMQETALDYLFPNGVPQAKPEMPNGLDAFQPDMAKAGAAIGLLVLQQRVAKEKQASDFRIKMARLILTKAALRKMAEVEMEMGTQCKTCGKAKCTCGRAPSPMHDLARGGARPG